MKTADFIKCYCIGTACPDFDYRYGCRAYSGEECDEAFCHPLWRGLAMADRVIKLCEKKMKKREKKRHSECQKRR